MKRVRDWLAEHLEHPREGLPRDDEELADAVTQLVVRAQREPASPEAMELNFLLLEKAAVERQIAAAEANGGDPPDRRCRSAAAELAERIAHHQGGRSGENRCKCHETDTNRRSSFPSGPGWDAFGHGEQTGHQRRRAGRGHELEPLVMAGLTFGDDRLGNSGSPEQSVRRWICGFGLPQPIEVRRAQVAAALRDGARDVMRTCRRHG